MRWLAAALHAVIPVLTWIRLAWWLHTYTIKLIIPFHVSAPLFLDAHVQFLSDSFWLQNMLFHQKFPTPMPTLWLRPSLNIRHSHLKSWRLWLQVHLNPNIWGKLQLHPTHAQKGVGRVIHYQLAMREISPRRSKIPNKFHWWRNRCHELFATAENIEVRYEVRSWIRFRLTSRLIVPKNNTTKPA